MAAADAGNGAVGVYYGPRAGGQHALQAIKYWVEPLELDADAVGGGCVACACFNTPRNLNALTPQQQIETFFVLEEAKRDARVRALVWSATGGCTCTCPQPPAPSRPALPCPRRAVPGGRCCALPRHHTKKLKLLRHLTVDMLS